MAPKRTHVCSKPGCWRLSPCEIHSRPANASWSTGRDRNAQRAFRAAVLERDGYSCQRCGHHDATGRTLQAHHVRPGDDVSAGQTLCKTCHRTVDSSAR